MIGPVFLGTVSMVLAVWWGSAVGQRRPPCYICSPKKSERSCRPNEPMFPPKNVTIEASICSAIPSKHKKYQDELCKKYPGYFFECTSPGTTNTFSCQSSCGPPIEDVGKGLNLSLLQGNGLLNVFDSNRNPNAGGNLFDINNFNNDNGRGSLNFGNFGTLNGFNAFNNQNNNNNNNNNFNLLNSQTGANKALGNIQNNVRTQGRSVNRQGRGGHSSIGTGLSSGGGRQRGGNSGRTSSFTSSSSGYNSGALGTGNNNFANSANSNSNNRNNNNNSDRNQNSAVNFAAINNVNADGKKMFNNKLSDTLTLGRRGSARGNPGFDMLSSRRTGPSGRRNSGNTMGLAKSIADSNKQAFHSGGSLLGDSNTGLLGKSVNFGLDNSQTSTNSRRGSIGNGDYNTDFNIGSNNFENQYSTFNKDFIDDFDTFLDKAKTASGTNSASSGKSLSSGAASSQSSNTGIRNSPSSRKRQAFGGLDSVSSDRGISANDVNSLSSDGGISANDASSVSSDGGISADDVKSVPSDGSLSSAGENVVSSNQVLSSDAADSGSSDSILPPADANNVPADNDLSSGEAAQDGKAYEPDNPPESGNPKPAADSPSPSQGLPTEIPTEETTGDPLDYITSANSLEVYPAKSEDSLQVPTGRDSSQDHAIHSPGIKPSLEVEGTYDIPGVGGTLTDSDAKGSGNRPTGANADGTPTGSGASGSGNRLAEANADGTPTGNDEENADGTPTGSDLSGSGNRPAEENADGTPTGSGASDSGNRPTVEKAAEPFTESNPNGNEYGPSEGGRTNSQTGDYRFAEGGSNGPNEERAALEQSGGPAQGDQYEPTGKSPVENPEESIIASDEIYAAGDTTEGGRSFPISGGVPKAAPFPQIPPPLGQVPPNAFPSPGFPARPGFQSPPPFPSKQFPPIPASPQGQPSKDQVNTVQKPPSVGAQVPKGYGDQNGKAAEPQPSGGYPREEVPQDYGQQGSSPSGTPQNYPGGNDPARQGIPVSNLQAESPKESSPSDGPGPRGGYPTYDLSNDVVYPKGAAPPNVGGNQQQPPLEKYTDYADNSGQPLPDPRNYAHTGSPSSGQSGGDYQHAPQNHPDAAGNPGGSHHSPSSEETMHVPAYSQTDPVTDGVSNNGQRYPDTANDPVGSNPQGYPSDSLPKASASDPGAYPGSADEYPQPDPYPSQPSANDYQPASASDSSGATDAYNSASQSDGSYPPYEGESTARQGEQGGAPVVVVDESRGGVPAVDTASSPSREAPPGIFDVPNKGKNSGTKSSSSPSSSSLPGGTSSAGQNRLPPEAFQNPFTNPGASFGRRRDRFESNPSYVGTPLFSEGFLDSPDDYDGFVNRPRGPDAVDIGANQLFPGFQQFENGGVNEMLGLKKNKGSNVGGGNNNNNNNNNNNVFSLFSQPPGKSPRPLQQDAGQGNTFNVFTGQGTSTQKAGVGVFSPDFMANSIGSSFLNARQNRQRPGSGIGPPYTQGQPGSTALPSAPSFPGRPVPSRGTSRDRQPLVSGPQSTQPSNPTPQNNPGVYPTLQNNPGLYPSLPANPGYPGQQSNPGAFPTNQDNRQRLFPTSQDSNQQADSNSDPFGRTRTDSGFPSDRLSGSSSSSGRSPAGRGFDSSGFLGFGDADTKDNGFSGSFGSFDDNGGFGDDGFDSKYLSDDLFNNEDTKGESSVDVKDTGNAAATSKPTSGQK